jgi:hypothetical protein
LGNIVVVKSKCLVIITQIKENVIGDKCKKINGVYEDEGVSEMIRSSVYEVCGGLMEWLKC